MVLVYSISSRSTFTQIANLHDLMIEAQSLNFGRDGDMERPRYSKPFCLVGNKCDVQGREISQSEGLEQAKKLGCPFFETSAKTCLNIDACFDSLIRAIRGNVVDITENNRKSRSRKSLASFHLAFQARNLLATRSRQSLWRSVSKIFR